MTDNEIIKSMQCVIGKEMLCSECTYQKVLPFPSCRMMCAKNALDLVNRQKIESNKYRNRVQSQKGEITRLHKKVEELTAELEEQKAEIERLNEKITAKDESNYYFMGQLRLAREKLLTAKFEAIKEFAERLKEKCYEDFQETYEMLSPYVTDDDIDNLVKEMTEGEE